MEKSICFVVSSFATTAIGGAELQVYLLSEELLKRGWQVEIVMREPNGEINSEYYNEKISYHYYKQKSFSLLNLLSVTQALEKTNSYFYYQRVDNAATAAVWQYCNKKGKKMIYALAADPHASRNLFQTFAKKSNKSFFKRIIHKLDSIFQDKIVEEAKENAHLVLCQTQSQQVEFNKNFKRQSIVLRNSFPIDFTEQLPEKEKIIIWVGNCREAKYPEAYFELISKNNLPDWQFKLIGRIGNYKEKMQTALQRENFEYLGELPFNETLKWFKRAKILVNTSISEGFTNTFIQAWIYKTVICSRTIDPDALLSKHGYGIFSHTTQNLLADLELLCKDERQTTQLSEIAYKFAINEFDIKRNIDKFEKIIQTL